MCTSYHVNVFENLDNARLFYWMLEDKSEEHWLNCVYPIGSANVFFYFTKKAAALLEQARLADHARLVDFHKKAAAILEQKQFTEQARLIKKPPRNSKILATNRWNFCLFFPGNLIYGFDCGTHAIMFRSLWRTPDCPSADELAKIELPKPPFLRIYPVDTPIPPMYTGAIELTHGPILVVGFPREVRDDHSRV